MKTTVEIDDPLLREAKEIAARTGTTLRDLMQRGLREVIAAERKPKNKLKLVIKPFHGNGLTDEFKNATPDQWLEAMYGTPSIDRD